MNSQEIEEKGLPERVGDRLRRLREKKGLTQPEAAIGAGVGNRSIWRWENGEQLPGGRNLEKLAAFYDTTAAAILR